MGQNFDVEIELRTDPYKIKVGDKIYEFVPELDSGTFLDSYKKLQDVRAALPEEEENTSIETLQGLREANKQYLASMMFPESREDFLENPPPDRIVAIMTSTVMDHYSSGTASDERPTGSSSDSSAGRSTIGPRSTGTLPSRGSIRAAGR